MNRSLTGLFVGAAVVASVACQKDNTPIRTTSSGGTTISSSADSADGRGNSLVRVVNTLGVGKDVAVHLGERTLFTSVKPASVTDYREISSNMANLSVHAAGITDGTMLAQRDQIVLDGNRYSVFLIAEDVSRNMLRIVRDDVTPGSGRARIRVVHAAFGGPELAISIAGTNEKLFSGVTFGSEAGYKDVDPATVTLEVRAKDDPKVLLLVPKVKLKLGASTTVVIAGASELTAFSFTDALMAPTPRT